ncbi:MAG TPA: formimidoylglutamate deiminase [Actinomycetota bacterium]|nr:formimidoylglutamate deiminase [Actinomycetota bacterium]
MTAFHCTHALVGGTLRKGVRIEVQGERIVSVTADTRAEPNDTALDGLVIPGLANAHSHAFQRALRGRSHSVGGDFWRWRELMYETSGRLGPENYRALARATFAEMALAGITCVGEFHYVHHMPDGSPYPDANGMGKAIIQAATDAGIRITLLDTLYLQGGIDGRPLSPEQLRFSDGDVEAWRERVIALSEAFERSTVQIGLAIHSVRAVSRRSMARAAELRDELDARLHIHLSEQAAENDDCLAATGMSPTALCHAEGVLSKATTAVHATRIAPDDAAMLAESGTGVCVCPTTERDLADGIAPAVILAEYGIPMSFGSDSNAVIDVFEEARLAELDERFVRRERGLIEPELLMGAATWGGAASLGWRAGEIIEGMLADLVVLDPYSPRLAGWTPGDAIAHIIYSATAADVLDVIVGGRTIVKKGQHLMIGDVGRYLDAAIEGVAW